jgi:hypothetical protein
MKWEDLVTKQCDLVEVLQAVAVLFCVEIRC